MDFFKKGVAKRGASLYLLGVIGSTLYGAWSVWSAIDLALPGETLDKSVLKVFGVFAVGTIAAFVIINWYNLLTSLDETGKANRPRRLAKTGLFAAIGLMLTAEIVARSAIFLQTWPPTWPQVAITVFASLFFAAPLLIAPAVAAREQRDIEERIERMRVEDQLEQDVFVAEMRTTGRKKVRDAYRQKIKALTEPDEVLRQFGGLLPELNSVEGSLLSIPSPKEAETDEESADQETIDLSSAESEVELSSPLASAPAEQQNNIVQLNNQKPTREQKTRRATK